MARPVYVCFDLTAEGAGVSRILIVALVARRANELKETGLCE